ncbi:hypothetical protein MLD38_040332 [Melastoma candidum]|uniref:Uncharacterized protein n=1 Tax=Melastoma candidum TaxID=119954 RepID=A0ACB9L4X9_9MYRT|nr:hypothetical protein MLD38_040332 [Melastoma candidum]
MVWFMFISLIGLYNLFKHEIGVLRAFNPYHMIGYWASSLDIAQGSLPLHHRPILLANIRDSCCGCNHSQPSYDLRGLCNSLSVAKPGMFPESQGVAVVSVMLITTCLLTLIMLVIWKTRIWWIVLFLLVFGSFEIVFLSANLYKFVKGGWFSIAAATLLRVVMVIWRYVYRERYFYELNNKVSPEYIHDLTSNPRINRVPGMALLYTELVEGIPKILPHFVANIPSIHSVLVVVSMKNLPISMVVAEERFLFRQVNPKRFQMFRCVARYGYNYVIGGPHEFEQELLERLKDFIRSEQHLLAGHDEDSVEEEIKFVETTMLQGVVYLLGEAEVVAQPDSSIVKRIVVV